MKIACCKLLAINTGDQKNAVPNENNSDRKEVLSASPKQAASQEPEA